MILTFVTILVVGLGDFVRYVRAVLLLLLVRYVTDLPGVVAVLPLRHSWVHVEWWWSADCTFCRGFGSGFKVGFVPLRVRVTWVLPGSAAGLPRSCCHHRHVGLPRRCACAFAAAAYHAASNFILAASCRRRRWLWFAAALCNVARPAVPAITYRRQPAPLCLPAWTLPPRPRLEWAGLLSILMQFRVFSLSSLLSSGGRERQTTVRAPWPAAIM